MYMLSESESQLTPRFLFPFSALQVATHQGLAFGRLWASSLLASAERLADYSFVDVQTEATDCSLKVRVSRVCF